MKKCLLAIAAAAAMMAASISFAGDYVEPTDVFIDAGHLTLHESALQNEPTKVNDLPIVQLKVTDNQFDYDQVFVIGNEPMVLSNADGNCGNCQGSNSELIVIDTFSASVGLTALKIPGWSPGDVVVMNGAVFREPLPG